jgi:uncharacterized surface protein with fasciclin (FAS1) repeats
MDIDARFKYRSRKDAFTFMARSGKRGEFFDFQSYITGVGVDGLLKKTVGYTFFIPSKKAFREFKKFYASNPLSREERENLVYQYFVDSQLMAKDLIAKVTVKDDATNGEPLTSIGGRMLLLQYDPETKTLTVDGARVIKSDIKVQGGVLHVLDGYRYVTPESDT